MLQIHDYDEAGEVRLGVPNITRWDPYPSPDLSQEEAVLVWVPRSFACCSWPVWPVERAPWAEMDHCGSPMLGYVQCGTCGQYFAPYVEMVEGNNLTVTSPSVQAAAESVAAHESELAAAEEQERLAEEEAELEREAELQREVDKLVERLEADLRDVIARGVDRGELPSYEDMDEPGVGIDEDGRLVAWDWGPPCEDDNCQHFFSDGHPPVMVEEFAGRVVRVS